MTPTQINKLRNMIREADSPAYEVVKQIVVEEMLNRLKQQPEVAFTSPQDVKTYLQLGISEAEVEKFGVIWLNAQHQVIADDLLFTGTLACCYVHPRELVKAALKHNAAACILYHNHPSGAAEFSRADNALTDTLKTSLGVIEVKVLDHMLICRTSVISMAEKGLL